MKLSKLVSIACVLSSAASASIGTNENDEPGEIGNHLVERGSIGGIKLCTDINWKGTCGYKVQPLEKCIMLKAPWLYTISSFGPDPGTWVTLYEDNKCGVMRGSQLGYPGSGDLRQLGINDQIGSFMAHGKPPPGHGDVPNSGPGSPFDPYEQLTCASNRHPNRKCNTEAYCAYTSSNDQCRFNGGDDGVPVFHECEFDWACPGSNVKCVNNLCCDLKQVQRAYCPVKDQLDACCFERVSEVDLGTGTGWRWRMQRGLPKELKCGC